MTMAIQQLMTCLLQLRGNVMTSQRDPTMGTSFTGKKVKVWAHITHMNFNFPFKLGSV